MMPFTTMLIGTHLILTASGRVPTFDVVPSCRAAGIVSGDVRRESCLRTEKEAREQIVKGWSDFSRADRQRCVETSTMGGASRSYVELLTCLELARDARKLPQEGAGARSNASSPLEVDARRHPAKRLRAVPRRGRIDPGRFPPWWSSNLGDIGECVLAGLG